MSHFRQSRPEGYILNAQHGVGLVEVLVAILLLAVAALGYTALQARSLKSTDESLVRTQAVMLLRSASEKMRTGGLDISYALAIKSKNPSTDAELDAVLNTYQTLFNQPAIPKAISCQSTGCMPADIANNDVAQIRASAERSGIKIGMTTCPGTKKSKCLIAAWNNTEPKEKKGEDKAYCMDAASGSYRFGADCVYMEAY